MSFTLDSSIRSTARFRESNLPEPYQQEEEQEVRVSQLFNTLLFTQQPQEQQQEEQEVRVCQLFNTLLFTQQQQQQQQEEEQEQEARVSELFNTHPALLLSVSPLRRTAWPAAPSWRRRCRPARTPPRTSCSASSWPETEPRH